MSLFISFEGPEGAGKSTQIALLHEALTQKGFDVLQTREPGGTDLGTVVRSVLLNPALHIQPLSEFLLYSASRGQLVQDVLRPSLGSGKVVLCDRYFDSSLAYQGFGRGLDMRFLNDVTWEATGGLRPHITFLLDLDPKTGLERIKNRGMPDRLEQADLAFHTRVREGFLTLAQAEPERFYVLNALHSPERIHTEILTVLEGIMPA